MTQILLDLLLISLLSLLSWANSNNHQDTSGRSTNLWDSLNGAMEITPGESALPPDVYESRLCSIKDIECYDNYCRQYDGQLSKCKDKSDWCQYECSNTSCLAIPVKEPSGEIYSYEGRDQIIETCADSCNDKCECLANGICNVNPENNECGDDTLYFLPDDDCTYCRRLGYYLYDILVEGKNPGVKSNPYHSAFDEKPEENKFPKDCLNAKPHQDDYGSCDIEKFILGVNFNGDSGTDNRGFEYKSDSDPGIVSTNILSYTDASAWTKNDFNGKSMKFRRAELTIINEQGNEDHGALVAELDKTKDLPIHGRWITSKDTRTAGEILDNTDKINCVTLSLESLTDGRYEAVLVVVRNHKFSLSIFTVRLNSKSVRLKLNYKAKYDDWYHYVYELVTYFDVKSGWIVDRSGKQITKVLEGDRVKFSVCAGECSISLKEHENNLNLAAFRFAKIKMKT